MAKQGIDVIDAVVCSNKEGNKNDHGVWQYTRGACAR